FVTEEWYYFIPLLLMSLTGITLVVWRILLNRNAVINMNVFLPQFQKKLRDEGPEGAIKFCRTQPAGIIPPKLFVTGLETSKQGMAAMRRAMANAIELDILPDLNFLLPTILALGKVATMVGLLFTVISMINTFNAIQQEVGKGGSATNYSGAI